MIDLNSQPDVVQPRQIHHNHISHTSIQLDKVMDALKDVQPNKVSQTAPLPSCKIPVFVDPLLEEQNRLKAEFQEYLLFNRKAYINDERLTNRVKLVAEKFGLENIQKSALSELANSLILMFQDSLTDLITISRQQRNMNFILATQKTSCLEGNEKHIQLQTFDTSFTQTNVPLDLICTDNRQIELLQFENNINQPAAPLPQ